MKKNKLVQVAGVVLGIAVSEAVLAAGIPTMTGPSGTTSSTSPTELAAKYAGWVVAFIAFGLMAFMFVTAMKNAWQIYHQLGEEGSKKTWRDLGANVAVGVLLVCLGAYMATKAIAIFGTTSL